MKPKEYLLQYRRALERVHQLDARLAALYADAEIQATAPKEALVTGSKQRRDRTAELAVQIAETSERLTNERIEALQLVNEISAIIDAVPSAVQARLLFDRYIAGLSWDQTASDIGYDPVHTRGRLHGAALEEVRKLLHNTTKSRDNMQLGKKPADI